MFRTVTRLRAPFQFTKEGTRLCRRSVRHMSSAFHKAPGADSEAKSIEASASHYFDLQEAFKVGINNPEALLGPTRSSSEASNWHVGVRKDALDREILSLNKLFALKDPKSNTAFLDGLAHISEKENHHAHIITNSTSEIYVAVHTHQARTQHLDPATRRLVTTKLPGLTLRDIRWAIQVEYLHKEFLADGRAVTTVPHRAAWMRQQSMQRLQQEYPAVNIDTEGNEGRA